MKSTILQITCFFICVFNLSIGDLTAQTSYNLYIDNSGPTPTTFLNQINISNPRFQIGYNHGYTIERATVYGGNLFVSQNSTTSNDYMGKWSFKGSWVINDPQLSIYFNTQHLVTPGLRYLVDYHRWGNYDAHFGLRERNSDLGQYIGEPGNPPPSPPDNPVGLIKDAIISWSYEIGSDIYGNAVAPNRLIFQSIKGIDPAAWNQGAGVTAYPVVTEHATILATGNFGLGISNPLAHFQIKPDVLNASADHFWISDATDNALFVIKNNGNVGIGTGNPNSKLHVVSNTTPTTINLIKIDYGNATALQVQSDGNVAFNSQINNSSGVQFYLHGNSSSTIFAVDNNQSEGLMQLKANGEIAIPKFASLQNVPVGEYWNLKVDVLGNVIADMDPNGQYNQQSWSTNGNIYTINNFGPYFGTKSQHSIDLIAGGFNYGKINGVTTQYNFYDDKGECSFNSSIAIGSDLFNKSLPTVDPFFALTLLNTADLNSMTSANLSVADWQEQGYLNCIDAGGSIKFRVGNENIQMLDNLYRFNRNICYIGQNVILGAEKGIDIDGGAIIPLKDPLYAGQENLGSSTNQWDEIWGTVITAQTLTVDANVNSSLIPSSVSNTFTIGENGVRWYEIWGNTINTIDFGITGKIKNSIIPINSGIHVGSLAIPWGNVYAFGYPSVSDIKKKINITNLNYGLSDLLKLRPVTFDWKENYNGTRIGFIAQEVIKVLPEVVTIDSLDNYGIYYSEIIPVLTKAIQELYVIVDSLKIENNRQFDQIIIDSIGHSKFKLISQPYLLQNKPNPFSGSTYIDYYVPEINQSVIIRIVNNEGKLIKAVDIREVGYGQISLDCSSLSSGIYHYSLVIGGNVIDTKSMTLENNQ